jgi:hypothetical protein
MRNDNKPAYQFAVRFSRRHFVVESQRRLQPGPCGASARSQSDVAVEHESDLRGDSGNAVRNPNQRTLPKRSSAAN